MTLHSRISLLFKNEHTGETFTLKHLVIEPNAPEWIKETDIYKDAIEDGCLVAIDSKEKKIAAENGDLAKAKTKKTTE